MNNPIPFNYSNAQAQCTQPYVQPTLERVIRALLGHAQNESVIADLGCGNGSFLIDFFANRPTHKLYGIDGSPSGIEQAQKNGPTINFHVDDLTRDLSSHPAWGSCDMVISTEVIEHLYNPRAFLQNCHGFLKPGGKLVISTPYHGYLKNLTLALTGKMEFHYMVMYDGGHIKFFSKETLSQMASEFGFCLLSFHGVGRLPLLWKSMILVLERPA